MRAVKFVSGGEALDLSAFLSEDDDEDESVKAASAAAEVADELSK